MVLSVLVVYCGSIEQSLNTVYHRNNGRLLNFQPMCWPDPTQFTQLNFLKNFQIFCQRFNSMRRCMINLLPVAIECLESPTSQGVKNPRKQIMSKIATLLAAAVLSATFATGAMAATDAGKTAKPEAMKTTAKAEKKAAKPAVKAEKKVEKKAAKHTAKPAAKK
jgi:hypothetical protein